MKETRQINRKIIFIALGISALVVGTLFAVDNLEKAKSPALTRQKVEYHAEGIRDPFKPLRIELEEASTEEETSQTLPDLKIQGVVWGGSLPQAIINNKVVKVGDTIEKAKIIDINKDGITILFSGRKYNIYSPAAADLQEVKKKKTKGGTKDEK